MGKDRKFRIAILSLALCTLCFGATAFSEALGDNFGTFVMAVGMVLGLYGGANVGNKWVLAKHGGLQQLDAEVEVNREEKEELKKEAKAEAGKP
jgi:hypothetical protein